MITEALPRKPGEGSNYGMAFGLFNIFWSLGYAIGPLMGGAIYGAASLFQAYLAFSLLMVVLAVAVALKSAREKRGVLDEGQSLAPYVFDVLDRKS